MTSLPAPVGHTDHPTHSLLIHMLSSLFLFTVASADYIDLTGPAREFTFLVGSTGTQSINVVVTTNTIPDNLVEGPETLTLDINGVTGPAVLGSPTSVTLTILDLDGKHYLLHAHIISSRH